MDNANIFPESASSKGKPGRRPQAATGPLLVSDLGWSTQETQDTRARLAALEEDWDAPGMDAYDNL